MVRAKKVRLIACAVCRNHGTRFHLALRRDQKRAWELAGRPMAIGAYLPYCKRHKQWEEMDRLFWGITDEDRRRA